MCYLFNAQSIVNKLEELHHVLYDLTCDCMFYNGIMAHIMLLMVCLTHVTSLPYYVKTVLLVEVVEFVHL